jgi:hypothetical protein
MDRNCSLKRVNCYGFPRLPRSDRRFSSGLMSLRQKSTTTWGRGKHAYVESDIVHSRYYFRMNDGGYCFPVLFCLLYAEIVGSGLLNADVEARLSCVRDLLVKKVSGRRQALLKPERHENRILNGDDRDVHIPASENKQVELPLVALS